MYLAAFDTYYMKSKTPISYCQTCYQDVLHEPLKGVLGEKYKGFARLWTSHTHLPKIDVVAVTSHASSEWVRSTIHYLVQ